MRPSRFLIEGAGAVVAALCVAFVLEVPLGPPQGAQGRETAIPAPEPAPAIQTPAIQVNRALKGDRLRVIVRPDGGDPPDVQLPRNPSRPLPDGCESAFGSILPATTASRCVT
jgi:hypothetical protein